MEEIQIGWHFVPLLDHRVEDPQAVRLHDDNSLGQHDGLQAASLRTQKSQLAAFGPLVLRDVVTAKKEGIRFIR